MKGIKRSLHKINQWLFFYFKIKKKYILATNPVSRPYSTLVACVYCEARRRRTVNIRRPTAPIAKLKDRIHTERIRCGIKHV